MCYQRHSQRGANCTQQNSLFSTKFISQSGILFHNASFLSRNPSQKKYYIPNFHATKAFFRKERFFQLSTLKRFFLEESIFNGICFNEECLCYKSSTGELFSSGSLALEYCSEEGNCYPRNSVVNNCFQQKLFPEKNILYGTLIRLKRSHRNSFTRKVLSTEFFLRFFPR